MSLLRIPSVMDMYNFFPFQANQLKLDPKHPSAASIKELREGFLRNGHSQPSTRDGCHGAEVGHKWIAMSEQDWLDLQHQSQTERYEND